MALVDPFVVELPAKLANDPEVGPYFFYLNKFLHDIFERTGGGDDLVAGGAQLTANQTFSGLNTFSQTVTLVSVTIGGNVVLQGQGAAVADAAAPSAITAYTPHASGAVTVTSNAATDLDTAAAALDTLVDEVTTLRSEVASAITTMNTIIARLEAHGIIAS